MNFKKIATILENEKDNQKAEMTAIVQKYLERREKIEKIHKNMFDLFTLRHLRVEIDFLEAGVLFSQNLIMTQSALNKLYVKFTEDKPIPSSELKWFLKTKLIYGTDFIFESWTVHKDYIDGDALNYCFYKNEKKL